MMQCPKRQRAGAVLLVMLAAATAVVLLGCVRGWGPGRPGGRLLLSHSTSAAVPLAGAGWSQDRQIEWLHIQKVGTSFGNTLLLWACPNVERRVYLQGLTKDGSRVPSLRESLPDECLAKFTRGFTPGVLTFGQHVSLRGRSDEQLRSVFTLVRSPKARLASGFHYFFKTRWLNATEEEICKWAGGKARTNIFVAASAQTRMISGDAMEGEIGTWGFSNPERPGMAAAEEACRRVHLFAFLGVSDFWEASVCLFHAQHGGELVEDVEHANVRKGTYSSHEDTVKAADCNEEEDEYLFECALELFLQRLDQHRHCAEHMTPKPLYNEYADRMLHRWLARHGLPTTVPSEGESA